MNVTAILNFSTGIVREREMKTDLLIYHCKSQLMHFKFRLLTSA